MEAIFPDLQNTPEVLPICLVLSADAWWQDVPDLLGRTHIVPLSVPAALAFLPGAYM